MSPTALCEDAEIISFAMGVRLRLLRGEGDALAMALDLPLEVVPSLVVGCFFRAMTRWRGI